MKLQFDGTREQLVEVARDLLTSRTDFYHYYKRAVIDQRDGWVDGQHIHDVCNTVQRFLEQDEKHILCLSIAPRHSKSVMLSNALPAWLVSSRPQDTEVMLISYALSLARDNLRACKALMDSDYHKRVFPRIEYEVDSADALQFKGKLNGRPNIIPAGVNGPLSGKGATVAVIDDPTKGMVDATSPTFQRRLREWWDMVLVSRIEPKRGRIIIVATRWTHDDLIGYVTENNPDDCMVVNFPAVLDEGTPDRRPLWPERFSIKDLDLKKAQMSSRPWEAQYMGHPTPLEGGLIKRAWLKTGPVIPNARKVRYWDKAATHGDGDWTVGCLMAESDGQYVIEDIVRLQGSPREVQETIVKTAERDGKDVRILMEQEPGSSGVDIIDHYARHLLKGYAFKAEKVTGSKETRASAMIASMEMGNLWMVPATWNRDLIDEMCQFPIGAHDDQVDACSGAFRALASGGQATLRWL